jgi:hypothetical protein
VLRHNGSRATIELLLCVSRVVALGLAASASLVTDRHEIATRSTASIYWRCGGPHLVVHDACSGMAVIIRHLLSSVRRLPATTANLGHLVNTPNEM